MGMLEKNLFIISNAFVLLFHMALSSLKEVPGFHLNGIPVPVFSSRWHLQNLLSFSFLFLHLSGAFLFLFSFLFSPLVLLGPCIGFIFHSLPHVRLVFWNSIHLEVASGPFSFLINSSWLLVF